MKAIITTLSISIVKLEIESGIDVTERIAKLTRRKKHVSGVLQGLWREYTKNPSDELYAKIEMHQEVLKDYEEEINFLINGFEDYLFTISILGVRLV